MRLSSYEIKENEADDCILLQRMFNEINSKSFTGINPDNL